MKTLLIETKQRNYNLVIGSKIYHNLLQEFLIKAGITKKNKILVITDENVAPLYLEKVLYALNEYDTTSYVVKSGEESKSMAVVEDIIQYGIEMGLDRSSVIVALGGGVVGDLAGFVSSIYMRGNSFVQFPTTILAHDSSVGGKVGINHPLGKNLIGSFHQPLLVFYDTSFLKTLPKREVFSGFAELIKHGLIKDKKFVDWLFLHAEELLLLKEDYLSEALYKGIIIKAEIVKQDERELGIRGYLNYGHTLAHAIEVISKHQYSHGEAVAIGMIFAAMVAKKMGMITVDVLSKTLRIINKFDLPNSIPKEYDTDELLNIMMRDKKFKNKNIRMILPVDIGKVKIVENIDIELLRNVINEHKNK